MRERGRGLRKRTISLYGAMVTIETYISCDLSRQSRQRLWAMGHGVKVLWVNGSVWLWG